MNLLSMLRFLGYAEILLAIAGMCVITVRREWRNYWALGSFLAVRAASSVALQWINSAAVKSRHVADFYRAYFFVYWIAFAVLTILSLVIIYHVFHLTVAPLKGLEKLSRVLFAIASVMGLLFIVSAATRNMSGIRLIVIAVSRLERAESLLTLCFTVLIFSALRPMGYSVRSRIFGIGMGLGILSLNDLFQTGWQTLHPAAHSNFNLLNGFVVCSILVVWVAFLALPEPKRGEIASPLLHWNERLTGSVI